MQRSNILAWFILLWRFFQFSFTKIKPRVDFGEIFTLDWSCSSFCRFLAVFKFLTHRARLGKPSKNKRTNLFRRILFTSYDLTLEIIYAINRILFMSYDLTQAIIYSTAFYSWVWKTKELAPHFIHELWRHPRDNFFPPHDNEIPSQKTG